MDTVSVNPTPVPRPRKGKGQSSPNDTLKKPIPLPRIRTQHVEQVSSNTPQYNDSKENTNDQHRKTKSPSELLRNIGTTSRLLSESISESLQEHRKSVVASTVRSTQKARDKLEKSVMDGTKHASLRFKNVKKRLTTGFIGRDTSGGTGTVYTVPPMGRPLTVPPNSEDGTSIFKDLQFNSPLSMKVPDLTQLEPEYGNVQNELIFRGYSPPPPCYSPPPLPDESVYDEPSSNFNTARSEISNVSSTSLSMSSLSRRTSLTDSEGGDVCTLPANQISRTTNRSDSWSYYDTVSKSSDASAEPIYSNELNEDTRTANLYGNITSNRGSNALQSPTTADIGDRSSAPSRMSVPNSLYENWELQIRSRNAVENRSLRHTPSVIREFDPLARSMSVDSSPNPTSPAASELLLLENLLEGDTYGTLGRCQTGIVDVSNEDLTESDDDNTRVASTFYVPVPPQRHDSLPEVVTRNTKPSNSNERTDVAQEHSNLPPDLPQKNKTKPSLPTYEESQQKQNRINANSPFPLAPKITHNGAIYESLSESLSHATYQNYERSDSVSNNNPNINNKERNSMLEKFSNALKRVPDSALNLKRKVSLRGREPKVNGIDRPPINNLPVNHKGRLYKVTDELFNVKQDTIQPRWCKLTERKLMFYTDSSMTSAKEIIPLDVVMSVQIVLKHKVCFEGKDLHCFELNVNSGNVSRGRSGHLFALETPIERNQWAQKVLEALTSVFPVKYTVDFKRAGWCYLKDGISAKWSGCWVLLHKRSLVFHTEAENKLHVIDLRKARCIILHDSDDSCNDLYCERGPLTLVDSPPYSVYLCMAMPRETKIWRHEIKASAVNNGASLHQQQLTKDDVPTMVDKCINFIYAQGSMSEGIYRRSGSSTSMSRLLTDFRIDAWKVQLSSQQYTEHDVAGTLKRFFRDLPESLFTAKLCPLFLSVCDIRNPAERLEPYQALVKKLPAINAATLRKLLGHLHFIHTQSEKNLMGVENLASIWGPTLLHCQNTDSKDFSKYENQVISDLIMMYKQLYQLTSDEISKEKLMLTVLQRYHSAANSIAAPNKPSGNIRMWVQLDNQDKTCTNVSICPQMTAGDLCHELAPKMGFGGHELTLEESVVQGQLTRPMHFSESVLQTVLRWGYFDDEDRKDNTLILKKDTFFREAGPFACAPCAMSGELKFADSKSKTFKSHVFEFSQAKLSYYKDKSGGARLCEWRIEDIVWYLGCESKRVKDAQSRWAITFIPRTDKPKRSKDAPYFGCTLAGFDKREQLKWLGVMLCAEYPRGVIPPAKLVLE